MLLFYEAPSSGCLYSSEAPAVHADFEFFKVFENLTPPVTVRARNHAISLRVRPLV